MNDELPDERSGFSRSDATPNAAALDAAMAAAGPNAEEAREFLREQMRLTRLQARILDEEHALELSHLKWRRFIERVRGTGHMMVVLAGLLLLVGLAAAVWSAASDRGLVVESFSVPPDLSSRGETGTVIAQHVLDRVAALQASVVSVRAAGTYSNNWGDQLKVQIPDTGISLGEAYDYLVRWLGHQTRITGEIVRGDNGFTATARVGTAAGHAFLGDRIDPLLDRVAERVFAETQPYRYGHWLYDRGRTADAKAVMLALARSGAPATERAWAYAGLMYIVAFSGSYREMESYGRAALALDPGLALVHNNLAAAAGGLGHSELAYREAAEAARLFAKGTGSGLDPHAIGTQRLTTFQVADAAVGDYQAAIGAMREDLNTNWGMFRDRSQGYLSQDLAAVHQMSAARAALRAIGAPWDSSSASLREHALATYNALTQIDISGGEWTKAKIDLGDLQKLNASWITATLSADRALAEAKTGNIAGARALATKLSPDCYPCLVAQGGIEAEARNWTGAAARFAAAAVQGPSLPFAHLEWGRMLLARDDLDGAIARFETAHAKGPHFADPLEMWGEALIAKNRSDLALAKFDEANTYAPNWGRLHLKWGEALMYVGRKEDAKQEFESASHLDLSAPDAAALVRWNARP